MNFDEYLKHVVAWNIKAFELLFKYISQLPPSQDAAYLKEVCRAGYHNNKQIDAALQQIAFIPDDEAAEIFGQEVVAEADAKGLTPAAKPNILDSGALESIKECERIFNTPITTNEETIDNVSTTSPEDWYGRIFNRKPNDPRDTANSNDKS